MTFLQSVFLGIIQGLTEFLPVSSSGHLSIMKNIFRIDTGDSILFEILLHFATLLVVFVVYRQDVLKMILEFFGMVADLFRNVRIHRENKAAGNTVPYKRIIGTNYRKFVVLLIVSTIPTGIIGVLGEKLISDASETLIIPGICLLVTAALLLFSDRASDCYKIPQDVLYREAIIIGIAQGFATLPGLSRSGATIAACLLLGLNRKFAVKYSFILSIPAILGATVLKLGEAAAEGVDGGQVGIYIAGMIAATVVGYLCIRAMLVIVKQRRFLPFAIYCIAAGILAIAGQFLLL